jgi:hypothetical protein
MGTAGTLGYERVLGSRFRTGRFDHRLTAGWIIYRGLNGMAPVRYAGVRKNALRQMPLALKGRPYKHYEHLI